MPSNPHVEGHESWNHGSPCGHVASSSFMAPERPVSRLPKMRVNALKSLFRKPGRYAMGSVKPPGAWYTVRMSWSLPDSDAPTASPVTVYSTRPLSRASLMVYQTVSGSFWTVQPFAPNEPPREPARPA